MLQIKLIYIQYNIQENQEMFNESEIEQYFGILLLISVIKLEQEKHIF